MFRKPRTKFDLLSQVTKQVSSSRLIARSTLKLEYVDGSKAIRYHDTDVVTFNTDGTIVLSSGGFRTATTKERIKEHTPFGVYQEKGQWFVYTGQESKVFFYDGITFDSTGKLVSGDETPNELIIKDTKKKIAKFIKLVDSLPKIPFPNSGDCWYCSMREVKSGRSLGDASKDLNHLISHLDEGYLHGSLIYNALAEKGYKDPACIIGGGFKDHIKRALRKYLMKRLLPELATN